MSDRRRFRYLGEPLFAVAVVLYVANSVWWKPCTVDRASFVHCYFGDVLCLPVCVPVALWLQRRLGLRLHDQLPSKRELVLHWLLWSACFEWLGPRIPMLAPGAVSDPWDAVAYGAGGLVAALIWRAPPEPHWSGAMPTAGAVFGRAVVAVVVAVCVLSAYRFGAVFR